MPKIKLTKGELKRQRDSLAQFQHYLPTLQLKKQQLQLKIFEGRAVLGKRREDLRAAQESVSRWSRLLADPGIDISVWSVPVKIELGTENVAGADLPLLTETVFAPVDFDFERLPYWVDRALKILRNWGHILIEVKILEERVAILERELRITTQRVNLFEKIKIPECLENIRKIRIYLGDQMANAVGISKVAKKKIMEMHTELATT